jgi:hypothetical protein
MNTNDTSNSGGLFFNEALFGLAILAFILLLVIEKKHPFRHFPVKIYKDSFVTNTTAFLINNLILTVLRASSLFLVAQQFASYGLLGGLENGPKNCYLLSLCLIWPFMLGTLPAINTSGCGASIKCITATKALTSLLAFAFTFSTYC